ncbi:hypothetical protein ACFOQM_22310 [Paenibacillus sp. GCM10012307]|uniref:Uncharacterized protein n=1 Tax=Paenibacillus roseus TaxID=2798579 RepID=A0A934JBV6_9BACL|nr:hypothetical protein [Paenibacillus roseus]MBJ6363965.1 hypothetical protein [Paenibacillus roseus]
MKKTKTAIVFLCLICIFMILLGCKSAEDLTQSTSEEKSDLPINHIDKDSSPPENPIPTETTNDQQPQYIDESKYEGDELGIVKTLNNIVKASYEKDTDAYNSLITGDMNPIKGKVDFKKQFLSIDKLDFTVKPDLTPPDGAKPVWVEYTEKIDGYEAIETDKQLFVFQFEDNVWKLLYIADSWQW